MINKFIASIFILILMPGLAFAQTGNDYFKLSGNSTTGNVTINDFTVTSVNGTAPLGVEFESNVTGNVTKWLWVFGPKSNDYYSTHAVSSKHTFTQPGKYTITLKVWDSNGKSADLTKTGMINVSAKAKPAVCPPKVTTPCKTNVVKVSGDNCVIVTKKVNFEFTVKDVKQITWNFGDGKTGKSCGNTISHTYSKNGKYTVKMNIVYKNCNCSQKVIYMKVTN